MLTLYVLAFLLIAGIAAFTALGVEDTKYHTSLAENGGGVMRPADRVMFWEDSLPGKPALPWNESTREWIESEGK